MGWRGLRRAAASGDGGGAERGVRVAGAVRGGRVRGARRGGGGRAPGRRVRSRGERGAAGAQSCLPGPASPAGREPDQRSGGTADPGSGGTWAAALHEQQRRGRRWRRRAGSEPELRARLSAGDLRSGVARARAGPGPGTPGIGASLVPALAEDLRRGLRVPGPAGLTRAAAEVLIARPGERASGPALPLWPRGRAAPPSSRWCSPSPAISKGPGCVLRGDPFGPGCKGAGPGRRWSLPPIDASAAN